MDKIEEQVKALRIALGDKELSENLADLTVSVSLNPLYAIDVKEEQDKRDLADGIKEERGLLNYLAWCGIDDFPKPTRKKLKKFLRRYDKIYEMLHKEGIYFDYS